MSNHIPRKRFGQHFLVDEYVIQQIVNALHPTPTDHLVEIGAGQGALTRHVLSQGLALDVVEIDRDLCAFLRQEYANTALSVHEGNALTFDFSSLATTQQPLLRVFGNLPYNISTPLLFHLLQHKQHIRDMTFMLQKEVVDRLAAHPQHADYGRLTIMIQYACQVIRLFDISPNAFSPPPKVMSSMVILSPYHGNAPHPLAHDYNHFAQLVNHAFQHRRKTLHNALGRELPLTAFEQAGVDPQQRPETLTIEQYVKLSNFSCNTL